MLDERHIPEALLPKARAWFAGQLAALEKKHGAAWPENRSWLVEYLNEDIRQHLQKRGHHDTN